MGEGRTLARDGLIYVGATLAAKGTPFILLIVYAHILSPADYGLVGTVMATVTIASVYVGLRPDIYVVKHYHQVPGELGDRITALYQILVFTLLIVLAVLLLGIPWLPISGLSGVVFAFAVAGLAGARGAQLIPESVLMSGGRSGLYALSQVVMAVGFVAVTLPLAYAFRSWESVAFGNLVTWLVGAFVATLLAWRQFGARDPATYVRVKRKQIGEAVGFLFPLTFHVIGFTSVNAIDRLILLDMKGAETVGAYTAAYTLGLVLGTGHEALLKAWNPYFFRRVNAAGVHLRAMLGVQSAYAAASVLSAIIYGLLARYAFDFLFPPEYAHAAAIVPVICLAYGLEGARKVFCGQLYVFSRTKTLAAISLLAAVINIVLNLAWIPTLGIAGAAYATLAAFALMTGAVVALSIYLSCVKGSVHRAV